MSDQQEQIKGRLFLYGALEPRDELDERLEKCHKDMVSSVGHLREVEAYNQLNDKVNQSKENHEDINLALLYSILTNPTTASKQYHTLTLVNRDSFLLVISFTEKMVMERTTKLQETTRIQLMWLTREVVQTGVAGADKLCFALLKQLPAGSCSSGDIYIAENLMCILMDNRDWLDSQPGLISSVVYTYLSLIPCHTLPTLTSLREQEVQFCVTLIRTRFNECFQIGRDFVRLLQGVSRIPEITELWRDLINNPQAISPQCTGLSQLLSRRTSRRFIGGRVLLEVEIKLTFFLSKVKFGQHRRYQEWFQKKYLSGPESHHLIPELIRFVCCVIHPTNEVLGSDVIPRWALIGWLISLCQSNHLAFANAKLALFYDWLSYSSDSDNIMNIEPGILLMHHSLRAHPQVTASLLDFLCRMVLSFCSSQPQIAEVGIKSALKDILNKGVLLSLDPIFESPRLDEDLRSLVKSTFPEFFQPLPTPQNATPPSANPSSSSSSMEVLEIAAGGGQEVGGGASSGSGEGADDPMIIEDDYLQGEDSEVTSAFSDPEDMEQSMEDSIEVLEQEGSGPINSSLSEKAEEEEEEFIPLSAVDLEGGEDPSNTSNDNKKGSGGKSCDPWAQIGELPSHLGDKMLELKTEGDGESRVRLMEEVLQLIRDISDEANEVNSDLSVPSLVATPLADLLATEFACTSLMEEGEEEKEDEEEREGVKNSKRLCHQLFRELVATDSVDSAILSLVRAIRKRQSRVGYFFLCYLHRQNHTPSPTNESSSFEPYRKLVKEEEEEEEKKEGGGAAFKEMLLNDLKECAETDSGAFFHLLPSLCKQFSLQLMGEEQFLSLIVGHIDPAQLSAVMHQLMNKEYQLFGRQPNKLHKILMESLQWESFEQFSMWQLLNAEGPDPSLVIPSLANMNSKDHPEAISSALLFLKNESSGYSSIASLLSLPTDHAPLVEVIGGRWVSGRPTKCAKFLSQFLEGLEKKHSDKYPVQEVNLVLGHLQSILHLLNSKQIMEASEAALQKTLAKQFKSYPQLASTFRDLNKLVSSLGQPADTSTAPTSKKDASGGKRGQGASAASTQEKSSSKHEPKPKRRRITNRDEILVIDP